jgi:hypothetical protein
MPSIEVVREVSDQVHFVERLVWLQQAELSDMSPSDVDRLHAARLEAIASQLRVARVALNLWAVAADMTDPDRARLCRRGAARVFRLLQHIRKDEV